MLLHTTRFGTLHIEADDLFLFSKGLIGFEDFRRWVLLADSCNDAIGWLQSASHPDMAVAVVSPRRFVPDYRVRIPRNQLAAIELEDFDRAFVLNVVSKHANRLTLNLKAPLLFNLDRRLAGQMVTNDEQPVQWDLSTPILKLRKTA